MAENVDIVVGIPSYNNAKTVGNVVKAVDAGLAKYFPDMKAIIVNSDGGSTDGTPEIVKNVMVDHKSILLSNPASMAAIERANILWNKLSKRLRDV